MDAGLIDQLLSLWREHMKFAIAGITPLVYIITGVTAVAGLLALLLSYVFGHPFAFLVKLGLWVVHIITLNILILKWAWVSHVLSSTAITAGLVAGLLTMTPAEFRSPGLLAAKGAAVTNPLNGYLKNLGYSAWMAPIEIFVMTILAGIINASWVAIGMNVFMSLTLFDFLVPVAFLGLGFMISEYTRSLGFGLVRLIIAGAVQMFTLAWFSSLVSFSVPYLVQSASAIKMPDLYAMFVLMGISVFFAVFSLIVPFVAATGAFVISGTGALGKAMHGTRAL